MAEWVLGVVGWVCVVTGGRDWVGWSGGVRGEVVEGRSGERTSWGNKSRKFA